MARGDRGVRDSCNAHEFSGGRFTGRKWVRWTAKRKAGFLDELAATCSVKAAAAAVGIAPVSAYYLRRQDEEFAAGWQVALRQGYEMLELQLVGYALNADGTGGGPRLTNGDPARPAIDVDLALRLLKDCRDRASGRRPPTGPAPLVATRAQTNAAIIRKLAAIEARAGGALAVVPAEGPE